jgi:hypothetical protein
LLAALVVFCFYFVLFLGVLFSTKITNNNRGTKEGKKERASSLRNQAHESHLAYPSNEIRQFELRQTVSQLKKTMTGHGGYVMAIHGNLKANHDMVISCFAKARPSSHGRQLSIYSHGLFKKGLTRALKSPHV